MSKVLLSVCCLAFNHDNYIRKCLEGFVMQRTDFEFEVLIHDDASTDKTADIIREYESKFPNILSLFTKKKINSRRAYGSPEILIMRVLKVNTSLCVKEMIIGRTH